MRYVSDHNVVASRGSYGALDCNNTGLLPSRTWSKNERLMPGGAKRCRSHVDIATPDPEPWWTSVVSKNWRAVAIVCFLLVGVLFLLLTSSVCLSSTASTTTAPQHPKRNNTMDIIGDRGEPSETVGVAQEDGVQLSVAATDARLPALSFTALNFYHIRDGKPGKDYPWLRGIKLVEPHHNTTFTVTNARAGFRYRWKVRAGISAWAEDVLVTAFGAETGMVLTRLGKNILTLQELDSSGLAVRHLEEIVMVKYVRREIRTLTDDDRDELLDAMFTLWEVRAGGDGGGRDLFGKDYTDIWAITNLHFSAASKGMCDHIDDGLGFLTSHTQMSNTFEYSLQLVNPKVTLPYWDFTIESSQEFKRQEEGVDPMEPQKQSPLFKPSWFGGIDSSDHQVKDGRWAYLEIPKIKGSIGDIFQRLRSPWNVNQRPYLTRAMGKMCGVGIEPTYPWPTCGSHYKLLTKNSDFYDWVWDAQYDPHGAVHIWIGGLLDCEETYSSMAELVGTKIAHKLAMLSFIHRKSLYRDGVFTCSSTAISDDQESFRTNETSSIHPQNAAENSTSRCGCLDYDLSEGDDYLFILDLLVFTGDVLESLDADTKRKVIGMICDAPIAEGDHLQASSPMDPTFWPIHPTMERLWMFKRLTGTMTVITWPDHDVDDKNVSLYSDSCIGHRGSDVFPFGLLNNLSGTTIRSRIHYPRESGNLSERSGLSNREVLEALDPRIDTLPYVYDNFDWPHCEGEGLNFDDTYFSGFYGA